MRLRRLKSHPYQLVARSSIALLVVIALIETFTPNSPRLSFSAGSSDRMDFMPRYLEWGSLEAGWAGHLFSYQVILVLAAILGALITVWNSTSLRQISNLQQALHRNRRDPNEFPSVSEFEEQIRSKLQKAYHARTNLVEPAVGAFFITATTWLALVVIAGKLNPIWSRPFLAPPMLVSQNLQKFGPDFFPAMLRSGWHMAQGVLIGSTLGILLGFLLSHVRWLQRWTAWHVTVVSALPPFLLAEIFRQLVRSPWIPIFGVRDELAFKLAVAMASWAVLWPVLTATAHALSIIDEDYRRSTRLLGARSARERIVYLEFPFIVRPVLANLRIGFVIGLIVLLYAEGYGGPRDYPTLGYWFSDITSNFKLQILWALLLFTSFLVLAFEVAFRAVDWKFLAARRIDRSSNAAELARSVVEERRNCLELFEQARQARWPEAPWRKISWAGGDKAFVIRGVKKTFGGNLAFRADDEISMTRGEFVSVIGRSGSGKSTFVKLLLGFEEGVVSEHGCLELGGINMQGQAQSSIEDIVGYAAQRPLLLPHWTVKQNLLFGLRQQLKYAGASTKRQANENLVGFYRDYIKWLMGVEDISKWRWLQEPPRKDLAFNSPLGLLIRFIGISDKLGSYPSELSGGEAQRVHLLRWLILGRPILVLDEAFSALDQPLKGMVRDAIQRHAKAFGISVINISHDRADVLQVSDRVFFVEEHKILADASPRQLFYAPRTRDLAVFLGHTNLFRVRVDASDPRTAIVQRDAYREVEFETPEMLTFERNIATISLETTSQKRPQLSDCDRAGGISSYSGTLFVPSSDVNIVAIENGHPLRTEGAFRIESMRFTGTHYDMRLVREAANSAPLRIDAVVQDDDLLSRLPSEITQVGDLVGKRVEVSLVRGIMLPPEGT